MRSPRDADGVGVSDIAGPRSAWSLMFRGRGRLVLVHLAATTNADNSMGTLLRRPARTLCFFCQTSISPPPPQPLSFLCPHCACWNHYDASGDILSDDPAMHDEALNRRSFARRGAFSLSHPLLSHISASELCTRSVPTERSLPQHLWERTVLLCLPIEPEARQQPPVELSTALR